MSKVQYRDPQELSIHPAAKLLPDWEKNDPRYEAFVEDVRARGIDQPLIVDPEYRVIDGRVRLRIARQLQITQVPVIVREAGEAMGVIVNSLLQRRHYTKGQIAYVTAPLMADLFTEAQRQRLEMLKKASISRSALSALPAVKTVEELADGIGIGRRIFFQARELHELFRKHPEKRDLTDADGARERGVTFKEFYEKRILREVDGPAKPYGLGAVKAGIMASLSDNVLNQQKSPQLELFSGAFDTLSKRFVYWQNFDAKAKAELKPKIRETVAAMPQDLRAEFAAALREVAKRREE